MYSPTLASTQSHVWLFEACEAKSEKSYCVHLALAAMVSLVFIHSTLVLLLAHLIDAFEDGCSANCLVCPLCSVPGFQRALELLTGYVLMPATTLEHQVCAHWAGPGTHGL